MKTKKLYLNKSGNIIYNEIDLEIKPDQLWDIRIQLGITSIDIIERQYQSILQKRRCDNLEILLD